MRLKTLPKTAKPATATMLAVLMGLAILLPQPSQAAAGGGTCSALFLKPPQQAPKLTTREEWNQAIDAVRTVTKTISGSESYVHAILTAMIARDFAWLNGDPGGAKTMISRMLFKGALKSIPNQEKKIFILQFHKLLQEGVITGFPKIKSLLERGAYEINTKTSLVGDDYLYLIADEAEKANVATLASLLSVLNERKAFLGSKVVNAALSSGVFTSNKTMGEFLDSAGEDRPTFEALADRMGVKVHVANQHANEADDISLYRAIEASRKGKAPEIVLPMHLLHDLYRKTKIKPEVFGDIADVAIAFDSMLTPKADAIEEDRRMGGEARAYFPANQFSNRSMVKVSPLLKASHIAEQIILGRPFDQIEMEVTRKDLHLLATNYTFGSMSRVRPKRVPVDQISGTDMGAPENQLLGEWDPYNDLLYVNNPLNNNKVTLKADRVAKTFTVVNDLSEGMLEIKTTDLMNRLAQVEATAKVDRNLVEYEVDESLSRLLQTKLLPVRTRDELTQIQEEATQLSGLINAQVTKPAIAIDTSPNRRVEMKAITEHARDMRKKMRDVRGNADALRKLYFESNRDAYLELTKKFPDMAHYIKATMVGLAGSTHVYAFGGPGGAKTLIARLILDAEVQSVNKQEMLEFSKRFLLNLNDKNPKALKSLLQQYRKRDPVMYKNFVLQFQKLLPEGKIIGFPKIGKQIDEGVTEYNFEDSMAAKKFLVSILDEVDKANPAVLTSLLSILNEREVLAGSETFKTSLVTAVLTSNKTVSEVLDSFPGADRSAGQALIDRVMNMVYVQNKMTDVNKLAQFLYDVENGMAPRLDHPLAMSVVRPMAKQVEIPEPILVALTKIRRRYMEARLAHEEKTTAVHAADPQSNPDYYVPAASPSNRTLVALMDQFKARIIVEQMLDGVPLEKIRYTAQMSDLGYFFEGMGYWGPLEMKVSYNAQGIMQVEAKTDQLDALLNSPTVNRRQKAVLRDISGESADFVNATNEVVSTFVVDFRNAIAQYPLLFPTLFGSEEARQAFINQRNAGARK